MVKTLTLLDGLIGHEQWAEFNVEDSPKDPDNFKHLTGVEDNQLAFSIFRIAALELKGYDIHLNDEDLPLLEQLGAPADLDAWAILARYEVPEPHITANLRAPLVINWKTGKGRQFVQLDPHPFRYVIAEGSDKDNS